MRFPPLLTRWLDWFGVSPVPALLTALAVILIALILARMALKLFLIFVLLLALALAGSYLFLGEERTERALEEGMDRIDGEEQAPPDAAEAAPDATQPPARTSR